MLRSAYGKRLTHLYSKLAQILASLTRRTKFCILLAIDVLLIPISVVLVALVSNDVHLAGLDGGVGLIGLMALSAGISSVALGLPRMKLNTYEQSGIQRTAAYGAITGIVGAAASGTVFGAGLDTTFIFMSTMALIILSVSTRLLLRGLLVAIYQRGQYRQRVLIYGAGQTGVQLATALWTDDAVEPIAFIDDNPTLQKILVAGLPVLSPVRIRKLIDEMNVDRVVLAMPSNSRPKQARLAQHIRSLGCEVSMLPSFASLIGEGPLQDSIQPLKPSEYLGRDGLDQDLDGGCDIYRDGCVMITGAGGSIGSELARQVLHCRPRKLVLFEVSEHALYQLDRELFEVGVDTLGCEIVPVLGSVTDEVLLLRTMIQHGVDTLLHAAAYKHVTMVEKNRLSGLYNNVMGTRIVAKAARDANVGNFILVSTDKAVHPTSVMGASKRLAELLIQDAATRNTETRFGIVRFGNVLGSSGSVLPLFEEQIARGGPVTLTHSEVTRYFMTLGEAARLVLLVGSLAHQQNQHGEVYLLDMGAPVPIKKLARQMIEASGYTVCDADNPDGDIEIIITGLRQGEKLHEELAMQNHRLSATTHPKIMRVEEPCLSEIEMAAVLRALTDALEAGDEAAASDVLRRWVGTPVTPAPMPAAAKPKLLV